MRVGHETTYASGGNHHFFTSCHSQTYQKLQNYADENRVLENKVLIKLNVKIKLNYKSWVPSLIFYIENKNQKDSTDYLH